MSSYSNTKQPTNVGYILGVLLALGIIGAIGLTAVILYFVNRPVPLTVGPAEERKAKLAEVNAKQNDIISSYAWVDQPNGVVRIPVERAMRLTIEKLEKAKKGAKEVPEESKEGVTKS
jgi:hypothetical protein